MTIALSPQLTFENFLQTRPVEGRYEFVEGEIVRILATRQHDDVADFLAKVIDGLRPTGGHREIDRGGLNYRVSGRISLVTLTAQDKEQSRNPDVSVVTKAIWNANLLSYRPLREPLQLAIEVVSSNWEDDYVDKLAEYEQAGVAEYWIVDYLALGSRSLLGTPKVPTFFVYALADGKYVVQQFQADEPIVSPTFPALQLTLNQVLDAAYGEE
jgi:Uma2 family endonuclease